MIARDASPEEAKQFVRNQMDVGVDLSIVSIRGITIGGMHEGTEPIFVSARQVREAIQDLQRFIC